jgi:hypothetical protein
MKINRLILVIILACFGTLTVSGIAFSISLVKNDNLKEDFTTTEGVQSEELTELDTISITTVEIICDCNDDSCSPQPEPQIEFKPEPKPVPKPVRGLW